MGADRNVLFIASFLLSGALAAAMWFCAPHALAANTHVHTTVHIQSESGGNVSVGGAGGEGGANGEDGIDGADGRVIEGPTESSVHIRTLIDDATTTVIRTSAASGSIHATDRHISPDGQVRSSVQYRVGAAEQELSVTGNRKEHVPGARSEQSVTTRAPHTDDAPYAATQGNTAIPASHSNIISEVRSTLTASTTSEATETLFIDTHEVIAAFRRTFSAIITNIYELFAYMAAARHG